MIYYDVDGLIKNRDMGCSEVFVVNEQGVLHVNQSSSP